MKRTFTKRVNSVLAAVLTIVALMVGQQALAESKTVTYKMHAELTHSNGITGCELTFERTAPPVSMFTNESPDELKPALK